MIKTVYVAGGSGERREAQEAIDKLKAAGWTVTHEWPKDSGYPENGGVPHVVESAEADGRGVESAQVFWLRMPTSKSEGAAVELGIALGAEKTVIVSGPWRRLIFAHLCTMSFDTHDEALDWLVRQ